MRNLRSCGNGIFSHDQPCQYEIRYSGDSLQHLGLIWYMSHQYVVSELALWNLWWVTWRKTCKFCENPLNSGSCYYTYTGKFATVLLAIILITNSLQFTLEAAAEYQTMVFYVKQNFMRNHGVFADSVRAWDSWWNAVFTVLHFHYRLCICATRKQAELLATQIINWRRKNFCYKPGDA